MQSRKDEAVEPSETVNREQEDEAKVIDAADMIRGNETMPVGESEHGRPSNPADIIPDDVPDIVDRMEEMVRSGHIDNDAFEGEPVHDDEEDSLGDTGADLDDDEARV